MQTLTHPRKAEIEKVRTIILDADEQITEQIKWNAPSFCYGGDDRVTFRLQPGDLVELIFHRGAKVRGDSKAFAFEDSTGLLKWVTNDRAILTLDDMQDVEAKAAALKSVVSDWIKATSA
jgi:hypothetical protein